MRLSLLILAFALVVPLLHAPGQSKCVHPDGVRINDAADTISINNLRMWIGNNGMTAHDPRTDASGLEWPRGSNKFLVFSDGLLWGGKVNGELRVGGASYRYGMQAGPILPNGTAADPSGSAYRIFKVRRMDATAFASTLSPTERQRLRDDFLVWPVGDGAPWTDRNGNGAYEPDFEEWLGNGDKCRSDTPWFVGDEVLWFVSNDLNPVRTNNLYGTAPVGLEVRTLVWGYRDHGALENTVFVKYTLVNKGPADFDSVYLAKWSDPDLGEANDDFCGTDTASTLTYAYNALETDGVYGVPPAMGYDFVQTPIVRAGTTDSAHYGFGRKAGFKNCPASGFVFYKCGDGVYQSPSLGNLSGAVETYRNMHGLLAGGGAVVDPHTGDTTRFSLAGDPVTGSGWIDGQVRGAGDCGFLPSVGPFTLARGDTQEVVIATIAARGIDRLNSIEALRSYDRVVQSFFDRGCVRASPPPKPRLLAMSQPDRIILHWGDPESVRGTEGFDDGVYRFEGYNVYQLPRIASLLSDGVRLATFDRIDNTGVIFDDVIDEATGASLRLPVQFGADTGIRHMLEITRDSLNATGLYPYRPYYFALTAYAYAPDGKTVPRQVESQPAVIEVRPEPWDAAIHADASVRERIPVRHVAGKATGEVDAEVIDPLRLTGDSYALTFGSVGTVRVVYDQDTLVLDDYASWDLRNLTTADTARKYPVRGSTAFAGLDMDDLIIDGFRIGVKGSGHWTPGEEVLRTEWIGDSLPYYSMNLEAGYGFFGSSVEGRDISETVEIRFDRAASSKGYVYLRGGVPNYQCLGYFPSPIRIFDVSDKDHPRQLQWAFVEQNASVSYDSVWAPTTSSTDREYLFILRDDYRDDPDTAYMRYTINTDAPKMPILYALWVYQRRNFGTRFPWKDGDVWRIVPDVPFGLDDRYLLTTSAPRIVPPEPAAVAARISVFPNPCIDLTGDQASHASAFATFTHLPRRARFHVYTIAGMLVRSFEKIDDGSTARWDLRNSDDRPVSPGMYIVHVDLPELGAQRILKLGVGVMYTVTKDQ
jgi:hypothetical protein